MLFFLTQGRTSKYIGRTGFGANRHNFFSVYFDSVNVYWASPRRHLWMKTGTFRHMGGRQVNKSRLLVWCTKWEPAVLLGGDYPAKAWRMIQHLLSRWEEGTYQAESADKCRPGASRTAEQREWLWAWEDKPGEAGQVTKGLWNHAQSGINPEDQSTQAWLHIGSPGNSEKQLMPKLHSWPIKITLCEGGAWALGL